MESKKLLNEELQVLKKYQEDTNTIIVNLRKIDLQINLIKRNKEQLIKEYQE